MLILFLLVHATYIWQRWQESLFQTLTPLLFQNFQIRAQQFFRFENPTPVQTPATVIDPTVIYPCFYLRNDRRDSCYCRNGKVTPGSGPVFQKLLTPGPKEKRRILPESTPVIRIRPHLWYMGLVLHAHPVRGKSHIQPNANREIAILAAKFCLFHSRDLLKWLRVKETSKMET